MSSGHTGQNGTPTQLPSGHQQHTPLQQHQQAIAAPLTHPAAHEPPLDSMLATVRENAATLGYSLEGVALRQSENNNYPQQQSKSHQIQGQFEHPAPEQRNVTQRTTRMYQSVRQARQQSQLSPQQHHAQQQQQYSFEPSTSNLTSQQGLQFESEQSPSQPLQSTSHLSHGSQYAEQQQLLNGGQYAQSGQPFQQLQPTPRGGYVDHEHPYQTQQAIRPIEQFPYHQQLQQRQQQQHPAAQDDLLEPAMSVPVPEIHSSQSPYQETDPHEGATYVTYRSRGQYSQLGESHNTSSAGLVIDAALKSQLQSGLAVASNRQGAQVGPAPRQAPFQSSLVSEQGPFVAERMSNSIQPQQTRQGTSVRDSQAYSFQGRIHGNHYVGHDDQPQPVLHQIVHRNTSVGPCQPPQLARQQQEMQAMPSQEQLNFQPEQFQQHSQHNRAYPQYSVPPSQYDQAQGYNYTQYGHPLQRHTEQTGPYIGLMPPPGVENAVDVDGQGFVAGGYPSQLREGADESIYSSDGRQHASAIRSRAGGEHVLDQRGGKRMRVAPIAGAPSIPMQGQAGRGRPTWGTEYGGPSSEYDVPGGQFVNDSNLPADPGSYTNYARASPVSKGLGNMSGVVAPGNELRAPPSCQENIDSSLIDRLRHFNPSQGGHNVASGLLLPPSAILGGASSQALGSSPVSGSVGGPSHGYHLASGTSMPGDPGSASSRPFTCKFCSATFGRRDNMAKHVRAIHQGERPYVCEICSFRFQKKDHCQKHVRIVHFKERPFECEICQSRFGQKSDLNKHFKTVHEKIKPYSCEHCGLTFGHRGNMLRHRSVVHEKRKPYVCPICSTCFGERSNLTKHARAIHGADV